MEEHQKQGTSYDAAYKRGLQQVQQTTIGDVPVFIVPDGMKTETLERLVDEQRERPRHLHQKVNTLSAQSFLEYYNRFATDTSTVFVDTENGRFEGVLDFHDAPDQPAHKRHRVVYNCPKSKEWDAWTGSNNEKMDQETFALFIEDNLAEIIDPNGAEMLDIATTLKAAKSVDFKQGIRLDNGQTQLRYQETIDGQAGVNGTLEIPEKIELSVRPFHGGAPYVMHARFRYRITPSGLVMWYTLIRPHLVHEDATKEVLGIISEGMAKGQILEADSF